MIIRMAPAEPRGQQTEHKIGVSITFHQEVVLGNFFRVAGRFELSQDRVNQLRRKGCDVRGGEPGSFGY